jgi:ribosomal protein S18 acetylase RimI-like enzyme
MCEEKSAAPVCSPLSTWVRLAQSELPGVESPVITLRPSTQADDAFLYETYASTRTDEMALTGWSEEQKDRFLRMQFEAQRQSYLTQTPDADYSVIRCGEIAVGRLIIERTSEEIHIVDIALLTQFRRQGIGSMLMGGILQEAAESGKSVRLFVERFNPALPWYERLGFGVVSGGPIYLEMVWRPGSVEPQHDSEVTEVVVGSRDVSD